MRDYSSAPFRSKANCVGRQRTALCGRAPIRAPEPPAATTTVSSITVLDRFEAENITWGISESVLVDGDLVFVTPAGTKALMAALNKKTGETVWAAEPLADEQASYASPVLLNVGEKRLLVNSGSHHAFAVDATGGEVLWRIRHLDPDRTITTTPILSGLMVATKDGLSAPREAPDAELAHCELADTAGAWWPAEAKIDSEAVVVTSASVQTPVAVRYAYEVSPENCNLYNWGGETSIFCSCLATDRAVFSTLRRVSTASSALSQSPRCSLPSPRQSESFHNSDRETSRGAAFRRSVATARGDRSPRSILPLLP